MNVVLIFLFVVSKVMCNIPQSEVKTLNRKIEILVDSNEKRHYRIQELEGLVNELENSKITFLALVICSGSISLGVIIALIIVCISCFKKRHGTTILKGLKGPIDPILQNYRFLQNVLHIVDILQKK